MAAGKRKAAPSGDDTGSGKLKKNTISIPKPKEEIKRKAEESEGVYEIRRSGAVICSGHIPNLGYPKEVLKDMARHGLHLYFDGKRVKL